KLRALPRASKNLKLIAVVFSAAFWVVFFCYHLVFARKIIPFVAVGGVPLGGLTKTQAFFLLEKEFPAQPPAVSFRFGEEVFSVIPTEIGFEYDWVATVEEAYAVGRSGGLWETTVVKVRAWLRQVSLSPAFVFSEELLGEKISEIAQVVDVTKIEAQFQVAGKSLIITPSQDGRELDREKMQAAVLEAFFDSPVRQLPVNALVARTTSETLEPYLEEVRAIVFSPPVLFHEGREWVLTAGQGLGFLEFGDPRSAREGVKVDESSVAGFVEGLNSEVRRAPRGEIFKLEDHRVVEFKPSADGIELDVEQTARALADAILSPIPDKRVGLVVKITPAPEGSNDYGIRTLLGQGISNFAGSSTGRIHNIKTAASRLDGILVAPGEVFSFNKSLGDVSKATGYDTAYIIKEGRTVLGAGGGVCQVSTTVFRAALNSGLPILARTAHDYRVRYYEPPVGFDATVYDPSPDLKFKNDTPTHILIESWWDMGTNTLCFEIYGTDDGRRVEISESVIHSQTPPPEALYQDDPTLPKGTTKQVDWAAWGARVSFTRRVFRGGEVLQDDLFESRYFPWRAIYLVGTKEGS
ncbi:VanW family protein, partial [Candidatus Parcubacteria bacterium]|nr:VanW family protein [Candidatus Parcubacteria bacterium]